MIVFLTERALYSEVFCGALSVFMQRNIVSKAFEEIKCLEASLVIIDGYRMHSQTLIKTLRAIGDSPSILISDVTYHAENITKSVTAIIQPDTPYREITALCQMVLSEEDEAPEMCDNKSTSIQFSSIEEKIISALKQGKSNKEIALKYKVPLSRVKYYLQKIYSKLGVSNRLQAALKGHEIAL